MSQEQREARSRENAPFELIFVRHGEPDWERAKNGGDPGLTELGRRQAEQAAAYLTRLKIDWVYCSPLQRARQTAEIVARAGQLATTVVDGLEEIRVPLQNLTQTEVDSYFAAAARRTLSERWNGFPGGESYHLFHDRVTAAVGAILEQYGVRSRQTEEFTVWNAPPRGHVLRIALVAHGGTNAVGLTHLLGIAPVPWEWLRFETALAAVSTVALKPIDENNYVWSLQRFGWREHQ